MAGFKSNIGAMNAAKAELKAKGIDPKSYKDHFSIEKVDGLWYAQHLQIAQAELPAPEAEAPIPIIEDSEQVAPAFDLAALQRAAHQAVIALAEAAPPIAVQDKTAEVDLAAASAQADALANAQQSAANLPNGKVWIRMSSIPKPTKQVWHIADSMIAAAAAAGVEAPSRKTIQDECVRLGIASGTARTQYQAWKKARDASTANAPAAAAASARLNGGN